MSPTCIALWTYGVLISAAADLKRHEQQFEIPLEIFQSFVDKEITPRFPDGLTWVVAHGQYKTNSSKILKEPSVHMTIFHKRTSESSALIRQVASTYASTYHQEEVLVSSVMEGVMYISGAERAPVLQLS
eukprot:TRINITY_DN26610_c0_g1_i4.p1 TRINITY_DN26610_c0_g1~~TRINITY_DN26610_c0_g1_i4.p1  ORF type:complete len:130 (-),score=15.96 TRINITY_DN26610_c0_g1_i4:37-426(-)